MGAHSSSLKWCEQMMVAGYEKDIDSWSTFYNTYRELPTTHDDESNEEKRSDTSSYFPFNLTYHVDWAWKHIHHVSLTLFSDGTFKRVVKKEPYVPCRVPATTSSAVDSSSSEVATEDPAGAFGESNLQYIEPAVYAGLYKYEKKAGKQQEDHITLAEAPVVLVGDDGVRFLPHKLTYRSVAVTPEGRFIPDDAQGLGFIFGTPGPLRCTADSSSSSSLASGAGIRSPSTTSSSREAPFHVAVDQLTPASPTKSLELENSDGTSFVEYLMKLKNIVVVEEMAEKNEKDA